MDHRSAAFASADSGRPAACPDAGPHPLRVPVGVDAASGGARPGPLHRAAGIVPPADQIVGGLPVVVVAVADPHEAGHHLRQHDVLLGSCGVVG